MDRHHDLLVDIELLRPDRKVTPLARPVDQSSLDDLRDWLLPAANALAPVAFGEWSDGATRLTCSAHSSVDLTVLLHAVVGVASEDAPDGTGQAEPIIEYDDWIFGVYRSSSAIAAHQLKVGRD